MDWQEIAADVGKAAPLLSSLLGGPAGGAVGALVSSALGTPAGDAQAAAAALADPAAAARLREIETTHIERLQALAVQAAQQQLAADTAALATAAQDRASARAMQTETRDITPRLLAGAVVLGWLCVQGWLLGHTVPADMREIIARLLGTLDAALCLVLNFYFGSSASSRAKDAALADAARASG
ncbi:hypothetical protein [Derxia gummosa]|uniref:TMhelix containing protein n=1 Tax=Derxia gummosa DSM 723 TaxID=1121388 RepID=A0A8B6X300_9BURK|nr:hypothetical protein [Derxia gummosa]